MHRLLPAALLGAILLAACSNPQEEATTTEGAPPTVPGPPGLWAVDLLNAGSITKVMRVCDDGSLSAAFARSLPMVGEAACIPVDKVVLTPDAMTAKCKAGEVEYTASTDPQGDLTRVFTLDITMTGGQAGELKQTARVRRIGDCPADWTPGDAAERGSNDLVNVFTGERKSGTSVN